MDALRSYNRKLVTALHRRAIVAYSFDAIDELSLPAAATNHGKCAKHELRFSELADDATGSLELATKLGKSTGTQPNGIVYKPTHGEPAHEWAQQFGEPDFHD